MADALNENTPQWELPSECTVWPYKQYSATQLTIQPQFQLSILPDTYTSVDGGVMERLSIQEYDESANQIQKLNCMRYVLIPNELKLFVELNRSNQILVRQMFESYQFSGNTCTINNESLIAKLPFHVPVLYASVNTSRFQYNLQSSLSLSEFGSQILHLMDGLRAFHFQGVILVNTHPSTWVFQVLPNDAANIHIKFSDLSKCVTRLDWDYEYKDDESERFLQGFLNNLYDPKVYGFGSYIETIARILRSPVFYESLDLNYELNFGFSSDDATSTQNTNVLIFEYLCILDYLTFACGLILYVQKCWETTYNLAEFNIFRRQVVADIVALQDRFAAVVNEGDPRRRQQRLGELLTVIPDPRFPDTLLLQSWNYQTVESKTLNVEGLYGPFEDRNALEANLRVEKSQYSSFKLYESYTRLLQNVMRNDTSTRTRTAQTIFNYTSSENDSIGSNASAARFVNDIGPSQLGKPLQEMAQLMDDSEL